MQILWTAAAGRFCILQQVRQKVQHDGNIAAEPVKQAAPPAEKVEHCRLELVEIDSPWSLFGNTRNKFQAVTDDGQVIYQSEKFKVSGFSYDGPEEVSKKYRDLVEKAVLTLAVDGWKNCQAAAADGLNLILKEK